MVTNMGLCEQVLDAVQTLSEVVGYLAGRCRDGKQGFSDYTAQMMRMLTSLKVPLATLEKEEPAITAHLLLENAEDSLQRICGIYRKDPRRAAEKLEFELFPITGELYTDIYFFGCVYPDQEKIWSYYEKDMHLLCPLSYVEKAEKTGMYKYEVSIMIPAFNHIDATKMCIDSLFQNMPKDLSYELILYNHGSNDGTKEYFESIAPTKQIDFKNNVRSMEVFGRVAEGKYCLVLSNDVIVTPGSIENLLTCIKSDEKVGMAAPTTPNISNCQTIPANYKNLGELMSFAKQNNVCDPFRWEQRIRLAPPAFIFRSNNLYAYAILGYGYLYQARGIAFGDDWATMLLRRNGYKNILCKDSYMHHIGSLTIKGDIAKDKTQSEAELYRKGRVNFKGMVGIDPWGTGFCYSPLLMQALHPQNQEHTDILGINCGMGENVLHIREMLKQDIHNTSVTIYNVTDERNFIPDLKVISDYFEQSDSLEGIESVFDGTQFDYIVIEDDLRRRAAPLKWINSLHARLKPGGKMAVCTINSRTGFDITRLEAIMGMNGERIAAMDGTGWLVMSK